MNVLAPQSLIFLMTFVPVTLAALYGTSSVANVINLLGGNVLHILIVVGGMMPALGIGLNLRAIYKGETRIFFFLGFLITVYFNLTMISIGFLSVCIALIYMQLTERRESNAV